MSYQVLARKWRPRTFAEMAGQEHVLRALVNALDHDRLHHAFLFTGTRGVGKTTIARILAKSLNCEAGVSSQPCGECAACREIDEGRFVDLIEVDAASRTKVEDTRELLENVQYAPVRGRYKVYLIDEVHMLSKHSFNALLKTLEEPPPHIKFLLATTDPQRLPVTILSRCLQFNLKRLSLTLIAGYLERVLQQEGIAAESAAVRHIARVADGSMRDALSLLDQAIAYGGGKVCEGDVRTMLGSIDQQFVIDLLQALLAGDGDALLAVIQRAAEHSCEFVELLNEVIATLHRIALAQHVPAALDDSQGDREHMLALAEQCSPEAIQLYYQIALLGRRDLPLVPDARSGFEMVMLRMLVFRPLEETGVPPPADTLAVGKVDQSVPVTSPRQPVVQTAPPAPVVPAQRSAVHGGEAAGNWNDIIAALKLTGILRELAGNCVLQQRDASGIRLTLDHAHAHFLNTQRERQLEKALQDYFAAPLKLEIVSGLPEEETPAASRTRVARDRQQAAVAAIQEDSEVKILQEAFDAQIIPETVQPLES